MTENDRTRELVESAQGGDRAAFDALVEASRERLRESVRGWTRFQLGPRLDVEEVLQETYVRAHGALDRFEWQGEDSLFRWLCGIAKRALAHIAQEARRADRPLPGEPPERREPSAATLLRRHERFDRLEAALEGLAPDHRTVVRLCRIEGLTSAQAAARMERTPAAVRQLLVRALRELRERFGDTESLNLPDRQLRTEEDAHDR